jgi:hypothetical protein
VKELTAVYPSSGDPSRWDDLFADLAAHAAGLDAVADDLEIAERTRIERVGVTLRGRVRAGFGREVTVFVRHGEPIRGVLRDVGADWLRVVATGSEGVAVRETVAATSSVLAIRGLPAGPGTGFAIGSGIAASFRQVLRMLSRDRSTVTVRMAGLDLSGTIDQVCADFVELAEVPVGEYRRQRAVRPSNSARSATVVPIEAIVAICSAVRS